MLQERKDILRPDKLNEEAAAIRDRTLESPRRQRWLTIHGQRTPRFSSSEAGACQRRLFYAMRGDLPDPSDIDGMLRLHDGEPHGAATIHWLKIMGYDVTDVEKEFKKILKTKVGRIAITGHVDGIIHAPSGPEGKGSLPYILECKGLSTWTMKKGSDEIVNEGYRYQAQMYMWLSGIPRTLFAIKDKNNSSLRFFEYSYNPAVARKVISKWIRVLEGVKSEQPLDREYAQDSLQCAWCGHKKECWG